MGLKKCQFFYIFFFLNFIFCNDNINNNKAAKFGKKRKLEDNFRPIKIHVESQCLFNNYNGTKLNLIKDGLDIVKTAVESLINISSSEHREYVNNGLNLGSGFFSNCINLNSLRNIEADLFILITVPTFSDDVEDDYGSVEILQYKNNDVTNRPFVGKILHNFKKMESTSNDDDFLQQVKIIFLHQFIHILGFRSDILGRKNMIFSATTPDRWNNQTSSSRRFINNTRISELAKKYYNLKSPFIGFELEEYEDDGEGIENIHYHPRILLGEIMSHKSYYVENYISEFTLTLLEDLGWYKINYYTGGLMRFGRYQGDNFFKKDCVQQLGPVLDAAGEEVDYYRMNSTFPNEFCSHVYEGSSKTFGLCSPGRQSMSYCFGKVFSSDMNEYKRNYVSNFFGKKYVEYCPITDDIISYTNDRPEYYRGSCKIGKERYGKYITFKDIGYLTGYKAINGSFWDTYSDESFCALSSLLKKNTKFVDEEKYEKISGIIHPSCFNMSCSEQSLTIQVGEEYFVCPREGGILAISNEWTSYSGILYCPDYNLICTGTEVCNNIFSCIEKHSISKLINGEYSYDYDIKEISMMLQYNTDSRFSSSSLIGFEQSENGKCPLYCRQCIDNKQCTLCDNSHPYYIGTKENDTNPIGCTDQETILGYYKTTKYINTKTFFFKCIDNCLICQEESKNICIQCEPTHYLNESKQCVERIPGCKNYDKINTREMDDNGGRESYIYCDDCNNEEGYYCYDMNRSICIRSEDYGISLNLSLYYEMQNKNYSCIKRCNETFNGGCETCNISTCTKCYDTTKNINKNGHCLRTIEHCTNQDLNVDHERCQQCDFQNNYYCLKENRSECILIPPINFSKYYRIENNADSCVDLCVDKYQSHCLTCNNENCTLCEEGYYTHKGQCIKNMTGCIDNYFVDDLNETQCNLCDSFSNYYCIDENKSICNKMNKTTLSLHYLLPNIDYNCYGLCSDSFSNCTNCNSSNCFQCMEQYIVNKKFTRCLLLPEYLDDKAACSLKIIQLNESLNENYDFYKLTSNYYASVKSINEVHYYIGNDFSLVIYINSACTENLFNEGYFSLDTNELNKSLVEKSTLDVMRYTIGIYINYNYKGYLRFHELQEYDYINPYKECPQECLNINYTLENNLFAIFNELFGTQITELIFNEKLDIFNPDADIYKDPCFNVTLDGIDIPINLRKKYLYIETNDMEIFLCRDMNCELIKYDYDTKRSTCICNKYGEEFSQIFTRSENEFNITKYKDILKAKGFSESVSVIKCLNNGFKYTGTNFGILLCIIAFVIQLGLYIWYCCCGKPLINLSKKSIPLIANPPPKDSNTRIYLYSDWNLDLKNLNTEDNNNLNEIPKINEEVIQPRDDAEDQILEEEKSFNKDDFNFSDISIDTNAGGIFTDKRNANHNSQRILEKSKKVLILLGNKGISKKINDEDIDSEGSNQQESKPLADIKKLKKLSFCRHYWIFLSIKQHIINYFSYIRCCKMTESYIPLTIRLIRSLFIICLSFLVNIIWLDQKYFEKKFNHFDTKYSLTTTSQKNNINIPLGEKLSYAFTHTIVYGLIGFVILTLADFLIGFLFFGFRSEVVKILVKKNTSKMQDMVLKARRNYNIFFVLNIILLVVFVLSFAGFEAIYQGGSTDYFVTGLITLILNELLPFLWSLILSLFRYLGIKKNIKCMIKFSEFFLY